MNAFSATSRCASPVWSALTVGFFSLAIATGCTADKYARDANRTASKIVTNRTNSTLGDRRETVDWPVEVEQQPLDSRGQAASGNTILGTPKKPELRITLTEALEIAVHTNRDYLRQRENLFISALMLTGDRFVFSPQLNAALGYLYTDLQGGGDNNASNFSAGLIKRLEQGGTFTLDGRSNFMTGLGSSTSSGNGFSSSLNVRLLQPLLRGAGYEPSHAALIQSERSLIYAIRDFELFREDFSIDVARRYFDLAQQYQSIENERRNLKDLTFGEDQASALYAVGRVTELDVLRARRNRLNAENRVLQALEIYILATGRFRFFLGLPEGQMLDIAKGAPEFIPVDYDVESAVDIALHNRLDLINRREQLEDFAREVRISKNGLLPDLNFEANANLPTGLDASFTSQRFSGKSATIGVSLDLPVNRVSERIRYRRAQIRLVQEQRFYEQFRDELIVSVESSFRELKRRTLSLSIQRQLIKDQEKNARVAQLRFERGELPNRDVVEAQQSLLDARNRMIQEQVNYEIARLTLLRDLGIVFIDKHGMWVE